MDDNLLIAAKPGPQQRRDWTLERVYESFPLLVKLRCRMVGSRQAASSRCW